MMQNDAETLIAHSLAYTFLGKVFYETPSENFISTLVANELFDDWPLDSEHVEMQAGIELLREFCGSWDAGQIQPIKRDYARLFVGPNHLLAPPWESVYLSPDHILFDQETLAVRQHYRRFGMAIPKLNVEPDDHIGLELRFVAYLCNLGLAAIEHSRPDPLREIMQELRSFFEEHLLLWAPDCLQRVIDHADTAFYRGAAHLTRGCRAHTTEVLGLDMERSEQWTSSNSR